MSFETAVLILAWIAILLLALAMSGLLRQLHHLQAHGGSSAQRVGPAPGTRSPIWPLLEAKPERPMIVLFGDRSCETCQLIRPQVQRFAQGLGDRADLLWVTRTRDEELEDGAGVTFKVDPKAFDEFNIPLVPAAVAISRDGIVIDAEPVGSPLRLSGFLERFTHTALRGR
jgi:hypothetical protein